MPSRLIQLEASNKALWEEVKAVRAENDRLRALAEAENARGGVARDECVRLRAELAEYRAESNHTWTVIRAERDKAEAAIVRARELCASVTIDGDEYMMWPHEVLRALDGAE